MTVFPADWVDAKCMVEGMLAEPWVLRGYQEVRLREFLGLLPRQPVLPPRRPWRRTRRRYRLTPYCSTEAIVEVKHLRGARSRANSVSPFKTVACVPARTSGNAYAQKHGIVRRPSATE
jgi:hypothetical protein